MSCRLLGRVPAAAAAFPVPRWASSRHTGHGRSRWTGRWRPTCVGPEAPAHALCSLAAADTPKHASRHALCSLAAPVTPRHASAHVGGSTRRHTGGNHTVEVTHTRAMTSQAKENEFQGKLLEKVLELVRENKLVNIDRNSKVIEFEHPKDLEVRYFLTGPR